MRALISVTNKQGVVEFATALAGLGFELISTGGTAKTLRASGLAVVDVADVTGFPEMLDGRVKTLHPMIHGGILADRRLKSHQAALVEADIVGIDVVCVNLYAFESTVTGEHDFADAIESIDIGGPAMIRAAAKNHDNVVVVVDPDDYESVVHGLQSGSIGQLRRTFAAKAFRHTAFYDSMVSRYLTTEDFPETLTIGMRRQSVLRYGENPHQSAAIYADPLAKPGLAQAKVLWGKELSYNNFLDADAAWELVCDLPPVSCVIIKHGNPCGAASAETFGEGYRQARASDPVSAFGGIAAFNGELDRATAQILTERGNFLEVVLATRISTEALEVFQQRNGWGQDVRLLEVPLSPQQSTLTIRSLRDGFLVTETDEDSPTGWTVVTDSQPTPEETAALKFQWTVAQHVKSNAIVVGGPSSIYGIGAGQMNRVQSVRLAIEQAADRANGAVLASDAFFPFSDSVETAAKAGIRAVIQPGGSKKDPEVIAAANQLGLAMVFTGVRHFRH